MLLFCLPIPHLQSSFFSFKNLDIHDRFLYLTKKTWFSLLGLVVLVQFLTYFLVRSAYNDLAFIVAKGHLMRSLNFIQNNLLIAVRLPATELVQ